MSRSVPVAVQTAFQSQFYHKRAKQDALKTQRHASSSNQLLVATCPHTGTPPTAHRHDLFASVQELDEGRHRVILWAASPIVQLVSECVVTMRDSACLREVRWDPLEWRIFYVSTDSGRQQLVVDADWAIQPGESSPCTASDDVPSAAVLVSASGGARVRVAHKTAHTLQTCMSVHTITVEHLTRIPLPSMSLPMQQLISFSVGTVHFGAGEDRVAIKVTDDPITDVVANGEGTLLAVLHTRFLTVLSRDAGSWRVVCQAGVPPRTMATWVGRDMLVLYDGRALTFNVILSDAMRTLATQQWLHVDSLHSSQPNYLSVLAREDSECTLMVYRFVRAEEVVTPLLVLQRRLPRDTFLPTETFQVDFDGEQILICMSTKRELWRAEGHTPWTRLHAPCVQFVRTAHGIIAIADVGCTMLLPALDVTVELAAGKACADFRPYVLGDALVHAGGQTNYVSATILHLLRRDLPIKVPDVSASTAERIVMDALSLDRVRRNDDAETVLARLFARLAIPNSVVIRVLRCTEASLHRTLLSAFFAPIDAVDMFDALVRLVRGTETADDASQALVLFVPHCTSVERVDRVALLIEECRLGGLCPVRDFETRLLEPIRRQLSSPNKGHL